MRVTTCIVRTPFGVSNAVMASQMYGGEAFETVKGDQFKQHSEKIVEQRQYLPGDLLAVYTTFHDRSGPAYDGREGEWLSILTYDGPPT